jgi:hypothetical protein
MVLGLGGNPAPLIPTLFPTGVTGGGKEDSLSNVEREGREPSPRGLVGGLPECLLGHVNLLPYPRLLMWFFIRLPSFKVGWLTQR